MPSLIVSQRFSAIVSTLREPCYGRYVLANFSSLVGTWVQRVAVGWLTWDLTGSGAWLGIVAVADLCPAVIVGPFAGALADRVNRLRIMRGAQLLAMLQAIALSLCSILDWMTIELLVVFVALNGLIVGVNQPNRLALVPKLVSRGRLATALAVNSIAFNLARFVGPAVAGWALVTGGPALAFALNALSFLYFFAVLGTLPSPLGEPGALGPVERSFLAAVGEGLRFAARDEVIGPVLLLVALLGLGVRPYVELLPGFADQVFAKGVGGLAGLASGVGIGAVVGGLAVAGRSSPRALLRGVMIPPALASLFVLLFAMSQNYPMALICAALAGTFISIGSISAQTLVQLTVAEHLRGRVLSLYGLVFKSAPAVGALAIGILADFLGLGIPLALCALFAGLAILLVWRQWPRLTRRVPSLTT